jgi:uncharacterized protein YebE (UPF0316 family)
MIPTLDQLCLPLLIFLARVGDVSIGTIRLICVTRDHRVSAVCLGALEVLIWVFAISSVFQNLSEWWNIVAYCTGFATGNALGMWIEGRLAFGTQAMFLISRGGANAVAERLRFADLRVTTLNGSGRDGPVAVCLAFVPRRRTPEVIRMAREIDPGVLIAVEDLRHSSLPHTTAYTPGKIALFPLRGFGLRRPAGEVTCEPPSKPRAPAAA